jgi:cytochrome c peroxidase
MKLKTLLCLLLIGLLVACQKQTPPDKPDLSTQAPLPTSSKKQVSWVRYPKPQPLSPQAQLGKQLFFDTSLSASGKMSCATCHDPNHAYAPANNLAVQLGGANLDQPGTRAVPSLRYLIFTPLFARHYYLPSAEGLEDEGPAGGFTQDGAVNTLHEQVRIPLLSANEMANKDAAEVTQKVQVSKYAKQFQQIYGEQIFNDPEKTLVQVGKALEAFQQEDASFTPYTSKFDAVASGNATFTESELRGLRAYIDPTKGNCAECHEVTSGPGGRPAQFTDFAYKAFGAPRNPAIPANRVASYFDMGLCGPFRKDLNKETQYCGMFKTPTLRNVATRNVFFHNGVFTSLEDVIRFYVERDSKPQKWYPKRAGKVQMYNDLPKKYQGNVDHINPPFDRKKGDPPALSEDEIKDMVEFLGTLTDGYTKTSGGE